MGADSVTISSDGLRQLSNELDAPLSVWDTAGSNLQSNLSTLGEPWGDDEMGRNFAEIYVPVRDQTFIVVGDVHTGFRRLQTTFNTMADNYDLTELHNSH
jgi:hypothetical protein